AAPDIDFRQSPGTPEEIAALYEGILPPAGVNGTASGGIGGMGRGGGTFNVPVPPTRYTPPSIEAVQAFDDAYGRFKTPIQMADFGGLASPDPYGFSALFGQPQIGQGEGGVGLGGFASGDMALGTSPQAPIPAPASQR